MGLPSPGVDGDQAANAGDCVNQSGTAAPQQATEDEVVKLAYEAAIAYLAQQDDTLGNLRNRATWLVTAAGLIASLAGDVGLFNTDASTGPVSPDWLRFGLFLVVAAIGACTVSIIWPIKNWIFGAAASELVKHAGKHPDGVRLEATKTLVGSISTNATEIKWRAKALVAGFALLLVEIFALLLAQYLR